MPRQYTRVPIVDRLLKYGVRQPNGCLFWVGYVNQATGYGRMTIGGRPHGVHAVAYREWVGPIPPGQQVQHLCDVRYPPGDIAYRRCFEPTHLVTGTPARNQLHMAASGRSRTGDRHPARLHPERWPRGDNHPSRRRPDRVARGEAHGCARLTDAQVTEIRRLYAAGGMTIKRLAQLFHVGTSTIFRVVSRKNWRHI
jgi:hypothetical protein